MLETKYEKVPYSEFGINFKSPFEAELANKLMLGPVRQTGVWYQRLVARKVWYGRVYNGEFDGGNLHRQFKSDYLEQNLRGEFSSLFVKERRGKKEIWGEEPVTNNPDIQKALDDLNNMMPPIARWIEDNTDDPGYLEFAISIVKVGQLLQKGDFEGALIEYLSRSSATNLGLLIGSVENWDDPMGDRSAPQAVLSYMDRELTDQGNAETKLFDQASIKHMGRIPFPAYIYYANPIMVAGALGKDDRPLMAYNIPNKKAVAERALPYGHNVIQIHPENIEYGTRTKLSPALLYLTGVPASPQGVMETTEAHERAHGFRFKKEWQLGIWRGPVREGLAAELGMQLTDPEIFGEGRMRRVVENSLAYGASDSKLFSEEIIAPYGRSRLDVDEILSRGGIYAVDGVALTRRAVTGHSIREDMEVINHESIRRDAIERAKLYVELAEKGDPDYARNELARYLKETRRFELWKKLWENLQETAQRVIPHSQPANLDNAA